MSDERFVRGRASGRVVRDGVQKVLVVDDSRVIGKIVKYALDHDPRLTVIGVAEDAYVARDMIKSLNPDVLILDVEMPRMSGLDFLGRIMRLHPMPVVMFSGYTQVGSDAAIRALVLGAVDCLGKPTDGITPELLAQLADRVYAAATAQVLLSAPEQPSPTMLRDRAAAAVSSRRPVAYSKDVILIGASTGGVTAAEIVLRDLPMDAPPVIIAQHMPASFLTSFAGRLDHILPQRVLMAEDGLVLEPGCIYLARGGDRHIGLRRSGGKLSCVDIDAPKRNGHCPSVDELFLSAVDFADRVTAVILTGLGRDGAQGMLSLRQNGAYCIAQDKESSVVYGMPAAAADLGAVDEQIALDRIAAAITRSINQRSRATHGA
ncbi:chemotaxis response regulator protein-glutamate methylesterase [Pseudooceanicola sp.]|uniref:protein-glutamate methylesterase/protein-glutamine glutaminase n=1 Tax=Pseudooceanicola sp. TaxID=1914328 RepID=UPI0026178BDE|nr:chemotaxis response regulator protein-glutamate methylesterase [Pseudooceanicola sp.]MDF1854075.1 chemotaxis response regulator protein-glutamate methylesterase [Pseudooceanicola sp.]